MLGRKHQIKHIHITLPSCANTPVHLRGTAVSSIAHYSSRPSASQLEIVSDTTSNALANNRGQKFRRHWRSIPLTLEGVQRLCWFWIQPQVFWAAFSTLAIIMVTSRFFRLTSCDKTGLDFPVFWIRSVDFAVQLCFRYKLFFFQTTGARFKRIRDAISLNNHNSLLCISTVTLLHFV